MSLSQQALALWNAGRGHAALHRGLWIAAPVFWASFAVFLNPGYGAAGFSVHALLCLPRRKSGALLLVLAGPAMALWFAAREPFVSLPGTPFHREITPGPVRSYTGTVESFPAASAQGFTFLIHARFGREAGARTDRVSLLSHHAPVWGSTVNLTAAVETPGAPPNPGQLDMRRVIRSQGAGAILRATGWRETAPPPGWKEALLRAREGLGAALTRRIPRAGLPLLEAALLNHVENVPPETQQAFLRSGMQHILAISGQHIGLLLAFLLAIALCVRLPRKAAYVLAGLLTAAYIPLTGAPVSVVRSGLMLACLLPGVFLERPSAGLHALCLTASLDLLIDPFNILNLGFQLSYGATLALILCSRPSSACALLLFPDPSSPRPRLGSRMLSGGLGLCRAVFQMTFLSLFVTLFTYAPLAASTHSMAPWGILGNLVTVPLSSVMLVGGLCVWTLDFLLRWRGSGVAGWVGAVTGASAVLLEGCVFFLSRLPGALRPIADASAPWLATFGATCLGITALLRAGKLRLGLLLTASLVAAESVRPVLGRPGRSEARLTFLAVGHGDAAVVELPGKVILIDAGDSPRIARQIILPFLRYRGISRLDAVMITHPDRDHFGGASAIAEDIPVGFFLGPPEAPNKPETGTLWRCLKATARTHRIPWKTGAAGQRLYRGPGVSMWMIGPDSTWVAADKNDRSLVALLAAGDSGRRGPEERVLFTGDIEGPGQRALEPTWPLWRGAALKAPHHGSDRTTWPCFIEAVAAPRALISCGSRRGFPGPHTLEAFARTSTRIEITKRTGAVTWHLGSHGSRSGSDTP